MGLPILTRHFCLKMYGGFLPEQSNWTKQRKCDPVDGFHCIVEVHEKQILLLPFNLLESSWKREIGYPFLTVPAFILWKVNIVWTRGGLLLALLPVRDAKFFANSSQPTSGPQPRGWRSLIYRDLENRALVKLLILASSALCITAALKHSLVSSLLLLWTMLLFHPHRYRYYSFQIFIDALTEYVEYVLLKNMTLSDIVPINIFQPNLSHLWETVGRSAMNTIFSC